MDGKVCCLPRELQYQYERGKISCRRLEWEGGAVSSRVALLLRSAEAQPYLPRFVWFIQTFFSFFYSFWMLGRVLLHKRCFDLVEYGRDAEARRREVGISRKARARTLKLEPRSCDFEPLSLEGVRPFLFFSGPGLESRAFESLPFSHFWQSLWLSFAVSLLAIPSISAGSEARMRVCRRVLDWH